MAKRTLSRPTKENTKPKREKAKAALDAVIDAIHDDNRLLEGDDLVNAIYEVFALVRPDSSFERSK